VSLETIVSTQPLDIEGGFGVFADALLRVELPELPAERRQDSVEFVCRRARVVPGPLRAGLTMLAFATGVAQDSIGVDRVTTFLRHSRLPFVGELSRMVRSLAFAFVWETWPTTTPTGAPGPEQP
jgi:hypothetical protein